MGRDDTLSAVLDLLVPPDPERGMPGAGALGLAAALRAEAPDTAPVVDPGLAWLEEQARGHGESFSALSAHDRSELLRALEAEQAAFVPALLFHLYRLYYARPEVLEALGMPPRPPHPEGYEMEPNDLSLLDAVRARDKLYREV